LGKARGVFVLLEFTMLYGACWNNVRKKYKYPAKRVMGVSSRPGMGCEARPKKNDAATGRYSTIVQWYARK
jgi:hypothetical protein